MPGITFAIAPDNTPYIKYADVGHAGKATVMKYIDTITGINTAPLQTQFTIHPNPSTGVFNITFTERVTNIQVYDVQGKKVTGVSNTATNESSATIDLTGNARGVYSFRATGANSMVVNGKLVVQ